MNSLQVREHGGFTVFSQKFRNDELAMKQDVANIFERIQARDEMFQSRETDRPAQIRASSNPQCCDTMLLPDLNKSYAL